MAFSYASAYKRFRNELEKKHELYRQLEMTDEQIEALDSFDTREFLSECVYRFHTQSLDICEDTDYDESNTPLYKKFGDVLTVEMKLTVSGKYGWMEEITSPELQRRLMTLSEEELSILDEYVFGEKTQKEIGAEHGIAQKNISKKLKRIKEYLRSGAKS